MLTVTLEIVAPRWSMAEQPNHVVQWFLDLLGLETYKEYGPDALWPEREFEGNISKLQTDLEQRGGGICLLVRRKWFEWGEWHEPKRQFPLFLAIPQQDLRWDQEWNRDIAGVE